MIGDTDEFLRLCCYEFFLIEARSAAFDAIEVVVDFVGAVEGDVEEGCGGEGVEPHVFKVGILYDLFGC